MEVSFATGGKPADVQATTQKIITEAAGDNEAAKSLGSAVAGYVSTLLAGVPTGQSAAVRVHVSIGVSSPAPEGDHPAAAPAPEAVAA